MMISQVSNFGYYPREASYNPNAPTPDAGGFAPEQPANFASTPTDNFNSSTSTQAPKKKPVNWLAWGALGSGIFAAAYGLYKYFQR